MADDGSDLDLAGDFESDLQPIIDELNAVNEALGYQPPSLEAQLDDLEPAGLSGGAETIPDADSSLDRLHVARRALEANVTLQTRLKRMLDSISRSQDSNADMRQAVRATQERRRNAAPVMFRRRRGREHREFSGVSWFWSLPEKPAPAAYPESSGPLLVTPHLPLVFKRRGALWSDEERQALREGVLTRVQEQQMNEMMGRMEALHQGAAGVTLQDIQQAQSGIRALVAGAPEVAAAAARFSAEDWDAVAHRAVPEHTGTECRLHWHNAARPGIALGAFSLEEDEELEALVEQHGDRAWVEVSAQLGGGGVRTPLACMGRHQKILLGKRSAREFTEEDLQRLNRIVAALGQQWQRVAEEFAGEYNAMQLMHHWRRHEMRRQGGATAPRKGKWSPEEDQLLNQAVALYRKPPPASGGHPHRTNIQWSKVSTMIPGRTDVQCRERYMNCLDPGVRNKDRFTSTEDALVLMLVPQHTLPSGSVQWSRVAAQLPGRTDRMVSKRWEFLTKARERKERKAPRKGAAAGEGTAGAGTSGGEASAAATTARQQTSERSEGGGEQGQQQQQQQQQQLLPHADRLEQQQDEVEEEEEATQPSRPPKKPRTQKPAKQDDAAAVTADAAVLNMIAPGGRSKGGRAVRLPSRLAS